MITDELDQLIADLGNQLGVPATRDPQLVRARIAQAGMCLTCSPPSGAGRALAGGALLLTVPVHLVLPVGASLQILDRALAKIPDLTILLGQWSWAWDESVPVGADLHPGFTVDYEMSVCVQLGSEQ